ncbi:non-canonical purine NTP diphosphatase [uncultured Croceitalea sp.]|uniref:non-canonical purine NTP diphosphatase n=1 Tax=uncultured Croceitalea sp. TaxID=1798908 RepID=UPI00330616E2
MELVFATHNQNKFEEVLLLMPEHIKLLSLDMIECFDEIEETGATLEENAQLKADFVTKNYGYDCFSDDTGLLVDALNGAPGVHTARYAGGKKDADANMDKLLAVLNDNENRNAHFKTAIALNINSEKHQFNGIVEGTIASKKSGVKGFGYDPIFIPEGYDKTFAELPLFIKNKISHRGRAIQKLMAFLIEHQLF